MFWSAFSESKFQATAISNAIQGFATYCDDLTKLTSAVEVISNKHVSFGVKVVS